jgi:hypothetical protein
MAGNKCEPRFLGRDSPKLRHEIKRTTRSAFEQYHFATKSACLKPEMEKWTSEVDESDGKLVASGTFWSDPVSSTDHKEHKPIEKLTKPGKLEE